MTYNLPAETIVRTQKIMQRAIFSRGKIVVEASGRVLSVEDLVFPVRLAPVTASGAKAPFELISNHSPYFFGHFRMVSAYSERGVVEISPMSGQK